MDLPKYDGNVHPDEWISDIQSYFKIRKFGKTSYDYYICELDIAISLVDTTIKLPTEINNLEILSKALKEDITFTVFKNTNIRKLQSLKYIPEREGGDTSKFISIFRKLCYNAEINDIEERKKYLYKSLPMNHFDYISNEFYKKMKNVNSNNELIKEFEDIVLEESNLIKNGSIIALKHIATGKYLSSIKNLCYITGSKTQLVIAGSPDPDPNSLWTVNFDGELATYTNTNLTLQHVNSAYYLGINFNDYDYTYGRYNHYKSPLTEHTEVSCNLHNINTIETSWKFNHSKLENHQGYLKSNDIINLSINKQYGFLRSHDIQFTIGNDSFQEVVYHNGRSAENDEWCIELIK